MNENLRKPTAGLSTVEMALVGSGNATEKILAQYPELGERPPAGLSALELARIGLESAKKRVFDVVSQDSQLDANL